MERGSSSGDGGGKDKQKSEATKQKMELLKKRLVEIEESAKKHAAELEESFKKLAESEGISVEVLKADLGVKDEGPTETENIADPGNQLDIDQLEREFDVEYKDPDGAVWYVVSYVDMCFKSWKTKKEGKWYAPCSAIVQSSGWGKSRVIKEIASAEGMPVVFYFSVMRLQHKGYPRSYREVYELLTGIKTMEQGYALVMACFDWYCNSRGSLTKKESLTKKKIYELHERGDYSNILTNAKKTCTHDQMIKAGKEAMEELRKAGSELEKQDRVCFLFVFDEAKNLVEISGKAEKTPLAEKTPFYYIRRACSELVEDIHAFFIFIDTNSKVSSKVSNFTPISGEDRSTKVLTNSNKLFPPLCRLPTFDAASSSLPTFDAASSSLPTFDAASLDDISDPEILYRHGRPLWASRQKAIGLNGLLRLALEKLMGGLPEDEWEVFLKNPIAAVALLGRRIAVDVSPQSRMAEEIVASHLGVCLYVSDCREHVLSATLPEPVLSDAVAHFYRFSNREDEDRNYVKDHLSKLNGLLLNGMVSAGERGELIARFIFIQAMDAVLFEARRHLPKDKQAFTKPVKLMHLLEKLVYDFEPVKSLLNGLEEAKVFFNAFHRFHGKPSPNDLRTFLTKCAAMICKRNQKAFDLYIPFVLPTKDTYLLNDNTIGCVGIQVKNWEKAAEFESTTFEMTKHRRKMESSDKREVAPRLLILMHMSTKKQKTRKCEVHYETLVVRGLHDLIVDEDLISVVQELLLDTPDPVKVFVSEAKDSKFQGEGLDMETKALKNILRSVRSDPSDGANSSGQSSKKRKSDQL